MPVTALCRTCRCLNCRNSGRPRHRSSSAEERTIMNRSLLTIIAVVVVIGGFILKGALFTVHQAQQALDVQFGDPRTVVTEQGLNFKIPLNIGSASCRERAGQAG